MDYFDLDKSQDDVDRIQDFRDREERAKQLASNSLIRSVYIEQCKTVVELKTLQLNDITNQMKSRYGIEDLSMLDSTRAKRTADIKARLSDRGIDKGVISQKAALIAAQQELRARLVEQRLTDLAIIANDLSSPHGKLRAESRQRIENILGVSNPQMGRHLATGRTLTGCTAPKTSHYGKSTVAPDSNRATDHNGPRHTVRQTPITASTVTPAPTLERGSVSI